MAKKIFLISFLNWVVTCLLFVLYIVFLMTRPGYSSGKLVTSLVPLWVVWVDVTLGVIFFLIAMVLGFVLIPKIFKIVISGILITGILIAVGLLFYYRNSEIIKGFTASVPSYVTNYKVTPTMTPEYFQKRIIALVNEERVKANLKPLTENSELDQSAKEKAEDMFLKNYWAHNSPAGTKPWEFMGKTGYAYQFAGENLARDFLTPESTVTGWMLSSTHKENILSPKYSETGVYMGNGSLSGTTTMLVVQHFGTPYTNQTIASRSVAPSKTGKIISYTEWCTGKQINIYENEIIVKKSKDGNIYGMTTGDWNCFENNHDEALVNRTQSRTGNIIPYHEWCTGKDISIYENEKIFRKLSDGKVYWLTAGDWECYDKGMPKK